MAPESCNLDRDEAEVLKPSSSSSTSPPPPSSSSSSTASPPPPQPPSLFLKSPQELPAQMPGRPDIAATADTARAVSCNTKAEEKEDSFPPVATAEEEEKEAPTPAGQYINRCSSCRKRVGLMGFRCRCGELFCGRHRYSDTHDCSFDYKAAGRDEIARANPVVRASKILKI